MLTSFESFIEQSSSVGSVNELLEVFLKAVGHYGYDRMIFCLLSDHQHLGLNAGVGHLRNYPADWMEYYFEQRFDQLDPVISYCYQRMGTFPWQEMYEKLDLTRKQKLCLNLGTEAGLNHGVCTPLWGPSSFAGIGLATSEKSDACVLQPDLITAYCNHFYLVFNRLHQKPSNDDTKLPNIYLTPHEKEVLKWTAAGKSDNDIAAIMNVSIHAIQFHLKKIYKKLHANSRILAVSKAISLGLIQR